MKILINIITFLLSCFFMPLFITALFGVSECQKSYIHYKQKIERQCHLLLSVRMQQVAPNNFAANPNNLDGPEFQKAVLGDTIQNLMKQHEIGKQPALPKLDALRMRRFLNNNFNYGLY